MTTLRRAAKVAGLLTLATLSAGCRDDSLEAIKRKVRADFPEVRQMSVEDLRADLLRGDVPLLLDVRRPEEYAVSHLPGALRVDPGDPNPALPPGTPRNAPIVVYCSVGYRSSKLARTLQEGGYSNVANLEGSIFEWAAEGHPMVRTEDGTVVTAHRVHPYSRAWAWLVPEELRSFAAEAGGGEGQ
ncbi:MAG: rhodanese-like domain-containing protein [Acidobacteriota bacterium]